MCRFFCCRCCRKKVASHDPRSSVPPPLLIDVNLQVVPMAPPTPRLEHLIVPTPWYAAAATVNPTPTGFFNPSDREAIRVREAISNQVKKALTIEALRQAGLT